MLASSESTTDSMRPARRISLILTVWAETQPDRPSVWRGYIETTNAQRRYFNTLSDMNKLLNDLGWRDPLSTG